MEVRIFAHSWLSDWNHGNANFLRGLARALIRLGHHVRLFEALPGSWGDWSLASLFNQEPVVAMDALAEFRRAYPELQVEFFPLAAAGTAPATVLADRLVEAVHDADLILVHEWSAPPLLDALVRLRRRFRFLLFYHDTHHRALTAAPLLARLPLAQCDALLVFGEALRRAYRHLGLTRAYTLHEAADETQFAPQSTAVEQDVLWLGNWGDGERTESLREFLLEPAASLRDSRFTVYGVRYPENAYRSLREAGVRWRGYLPNLRAPHAYAASRLVLHVPRRPYAEALAGIPTIRVFEALACGRPLLCAPWRDAEGLFRRDDFLVCADGREMTAWMRELLDQPATAVELGRRGRETVVARHTCRHRATQLLDLCRSM